MPLTADLIGDAAETRASGALRADRPRPLNLNFLPRSLTTKCRRLIETYHDMHGYACLPDMLWRPELRDFIEMHDQFRTIFRNASISRSAKRANEGFLAIATAILALEFLAGGFANWGRRFPAAQRQAQAVLQEYTSSSRTWLMERYLYPRSYINPAFISALSPPDHPADGDHAASDDAIDRGQFELVALEAAVRRIGAG